ncbi:hypothetical protein ACFQE1_04605 [Halobium palmae]|uniref:DUF7511 domain-containing protein n=1 Tax=Halobium palmae TaxID=1776492 RepID=A0ABD5RWN9_9EURY
MSVADPSNPHANLQSVGHADIELEHAYDDELCPTQLTLFSVREEDDRTTTWLSINVDHAVSLDAVR